MTRSEATDANGVTVTNTFDNLGRVRTRTYPDTGVEASGEDYSTEPANPTAASTNEMSAFACKVKIGPMAWLTIFVLSALPAKADTKPTPFPGEKQSLASPDRKFELINRDADTDADAAKLGDNHALFLREAKTGAEKTVHAYARHVETFWSPDARFIAVTDFAASDGSVCYIYRVAEGRLVNLTDALTMALQRTGKLKNHHVYFQAVAWQKGPVLKVKVSGYEDHDKNGFETWCLYDVTKDQADLPSSK
jgi:hypothetical protein